MHIVILTRGSKEEGLGHLVRVKTFVKAAHSQHHVEVIAIAPPELLRSAHCAVNEAEARRSLAKIKADVIVYDLAVLERETFDIAQAVAPTCASISPVFPYINELDLFFTRGARPNISSATKVYSGLDYAILNEECILIPDDRFDPSVALSPISLGIAMGGGDAGNDTQKILQCLSEIEQSISLQVFVGQAYEHSIDSLRKSLPERHQLVVNKGGNMWEQFQTCAAGIFSSGLSILEAVYAGLPVIKVERERDVSNAVRNVYDDLLLDGGKIVDGSYSLKLPALIAQIQEDRAILKECRQRQHGLVDGCGATRVIREIERFYLVKPVPNDIISYEQ